MSFNYGDDLILEQAYKAKRKVRTREDLLAIPLIPTNRLIKLIDDPYVPGTGEISDERWTEAFAKYRRLEALHEGARLSKIFKRPIDKLRYKLHLKLIQWKVII